MNKSLCAARCAPVVAEGASEQGTPSNEAPPQMVFPSMQLGIGTMRATGNLIALLLHLEHPEDRAGILAWAVRDMGISIDDLVSEYNDSA